MDKGLCEFLNGSPAKGIADIEAALALDPSLLSAYLSLASIHRSQGRTDRAMRVYERGLRASARIPEAALGAVLRGEYEGLKSAR